jgi:hypothetical protein
LSVPEKAAEIRHEAFCLQSFEFTTIEPGMAAFRAQIHDHLRVAFAPHFVHGHITRGTRQRRLLVSLIRNVVELEENIVVLHFDFFEVFGADECAFAGFANVHFFEDRVFYQAAADKRLLTTRALHGHAASVAPDERCVSSFS